MNSMYTPEHFYFPCRVTDWCRMFSAAWLSCGDLSLLVAASKKIKNDVCGDGTVSCLSGNRLIAKGGRYLPSEIEELQSEEGPWVPGGLERLLGRYLEQSPVGKCLFKQCFRVWPSPSMNIARSMMAPTEHMCPSLEQIRVPASCAAEYSRSWVTKGYVVYVQHGCLQQGLWLGALQLTTVLDWLREPLSMRLIMHKGHNLTGKIGKTFRFGSRLVMLKIPRELLRIPDKISRSPIDLATASLNVVHSSNEPSFRKYCREFRNRPYPPGENLDMWMFIQQAALDPMFPWNGSFVSIYEYLCSRRAGFKERWGFERSWSAAGLKSEYYCLDCEAWVGSLEPKLMRLEDHLTDVVEHGCKVVPPLEYSCLDQVSPLDVSFDYGENLAMFPNFHRRTKRSSEKDSSFTWVLEASKKRWALVETDTQRAFLHTRWKKTCLAPLKAQETLHFPCKAAFSGIPTPCEKFRPGQS